MRLDLFRGPEWRSFYRWMETLYGIGLIVWIARVAALAMIYVWPTWDQCICAVWVVVAVVLSWAWFKVVRRAANAGEFD